MHRVYVVSVAVASVVTPSLFARKTPGATPHTFLQHSDMHPCDITTFSGLVLRQHLQARGW
jgi:hypothetical protein